MSSKRKHKLLLLGVSIALLVGSVLLAVKSSAPQDPVVENQVSDEEFYREAEEARQKLVEERNNLAQKYYQSESYQAVRELYDQNESEFDVFKFTESVAKAASGLSDKGEFAKALNLIEETLAKHEGENVHYDLYFQRYIAASENGSIEAKDVRAETVKKLFELGAIDSEQDPPDEFFFGVDEGAE